VAWRGGAPPSQKRSRKRNGRQKRGEKKEKKSRSGKAVKKRKKKRKDEEREEREAHFDCILFPKERKKVVSTIRFPSSKKKKKKKEKKDDVLLSLCEEQEQHPLSPRYQLPSKLRSPGASVTIPIHLSFLGPSSLTSQAQGKRVR
jgi:hypothetical protein